MAVMSSKKRDRLQLVSFLSYELLFVVVFRSHRILDVLVYFGVGVCAAVALPFVYRLSGELTVLD